ncbi:uncharacterized protein JCM6883_000253 [Sporobolomyces salmoneus]|uniref:uncharacterized protein n=1 Tax=Sporobolomyces salmoneus TaxID=183962 RepID=UPI0031720528
MGEVRQERTGQGGSRPERQEEKGNEVAMGGGNGLTRPDGKDVRDEGGESEEERIERELKEVRTEYRQRVSSMSSDNSLASEQPQASSSNPPPPPPRPNASTLKPDSTIYLYRFVLPYPDLVPALIGRRGSAAQEVQRRVRVEVVYLGADLVATIPSLFGLIVPGQAHNLGLLQGTISDIQRALEIIKDDLIERRFFSELELSRKNCFKFLEFNEEILKPAIGETLIGRYKPEGRRTFASIPNRHPSSIAFPDPRNRWALPPRPHQTSWNWNGFNNNGDRTCYNNERDHRQARSISPRSRRDRSVIRNSYSPTPLSPDSHTSPTLFTKSEMDGIVNDQDEMIVEETRKSPPLLSQNLNFEIPLAAASAFFGPTSSLPHLERITGFKLKLEISTTSARLIAVSPTLPLNDEVVLREKLGRLRNGIEETVRTVEGCESWSIDQMESEDISKAAQDDSSSQITTSAHYPSPISIRQRDTEKTNHETEEEVVEGLLRQIDTTKGGDPNVQGLQSRHRLHPAFVVVEEKENEKEKKVEKWITDQTLPLSTSDQAHERSPRHQSFQYRSNPSERFVYSARRPSPIRTSDFSPPPPPPPAQRFEGDYRPRRIEHPSHFARPPPSRLTNYDYNSSAERTYSASDYRKSRDRLPSWDRDSSSDDWFSRRY